MKTWTETPTGVTNGAFQRFMLALSDHADVVCSRMNTDEVYVSRLAQFALTGGIQPSTSQVRAREIMDQNFFGVEDAVRIFGINPSRRQLAALLEVPFAEDVLEACKDTHLLVAVFNLSTLEVREKGGNFYDINRCDSEKFAAEKPEIDWHLVRKTPVPDSFSKTWPGQKALLTKDEETPSVPVLTYAVIGHFKKTGERLFPVGVWVRTSDLASYGVRVIVGYFGETGLHVGSYWDDDRGGHIGLASARKAQ